jgi:hypothetical protein
MPMLPGMVVPAPYHDAVVTVASADTTPVLLGNTLVCRLPWQVALPWLRGAGAPWRLQARHWARWWRCCCCCCRCGWRWTGRGKAVMTLVSRIDATWCKIISWTGSLPSVFRHAAAASCCRTTGAQWIHSGAAAGMDCSRRHGLQTSAWTAAVPRTSSMHPLPKPGVQQQQQHRACKHYCTLVQVQSRQA